MEQHSIGRDLDKRKLAELKGSPGFGELRKFMEQKVRTGVMKLKTPKTNDWQDVGFFRGRIKMCEEIDHLVNGAYEDTYNKGEAK